MLFEQIIEGFETMQSVIKLKKQKTDFEIKDQGHLVLMNCGHRGKPSRQEEKRISRLLRKSGFIPMLEELYGNKPEENMQNKFTPSKNNQEKNNIFGPKMQMSPLMLKSEN